jgi:hypothetical protein
MNADIMTAKAPKLVPCLSISTNSTGSHRTIFPVGTKASELTHDIGSDGNPTYTEGVYVEMITEEQAAQLKAAGSLHFSDTHSFYEWQQGQ